MIEKLIKRNYEIEEILKNGYLSFYEGQKLLVEYLENTNKNIELLRDKIEDLERGYKMKGVEKFEVEIADKANNKEGVVDALIKRYHVCEEVAEAMVWDSLATVQGLEFLYNDREVK